MEERWHSEALDRRSFAASFGTGFFLRLMRKRLIKLNSLEVLTTQLDGTVKILTTTCRYPVNPGRASSHLSRSIERKGEEGYDLEQENLFFRKRDVL